MLEASGVFMARVRADRLNSSERFDDIIKKQQEESAEERNQHLESGRKKLELRRQRDELQLSALIAAQKLKGLF